MSVMVPSSLTCSSNAGSTIPDGKLVKVINKKLPHWITPSLSAFPELFVEGESLVAVCTVEQTGQRVSENCGAVLSVRCDAIQPDKTTTKAKIRSPLFIFQLKASINRQSFAAPVQ